jgi:hypothetical protein
LTITPESIALLGDDNLHVTVAAGHHDADILRVTVENQIDARIPDRKISDLDPLEKRGKHRTDETETAARPLDLQA